MNTRIIISSRCTRSTTAQGGSGMKTSHSMRWIWRIQIMEMTRGAAILWLQPRTSFCNHSMRIITVTLWHLWGAQPLLHKMITIKSMLWIHICQLLSLWQHWLTCHSSWSMYPIEKSSFSMSSKRSIKSCPPRSTSPSSTTPWGITRFSTLWPMRPRYSPPRRGHLFCYTWRHLDQRSWC